MTQPARAMHRITDCTLSRREGKVTVEATVQNPGDRPVFVVRVARRIELDPASGVLTVWFGDRGRRDERGPRIRREIGAPPTVAIEPGGSVHLSASFPEDMTRLVPRADGSFELEAIDLSRATSVAIHVSGGDVPFYYSRAAGTMLSQLREWGTEVSWAAGAPREPGKGGARRDGKRRHDSS